MEAWWAYPLFFVGAFVSTCIGALVGGGSFVITSILLLLGVPPNVMVGSRRTAAIGGNLGALIQYHKAGKVDYKLGLILSPFMAVGLVLGWLTLEVLKEYDLNRIIAIVLLGLLAIKIWKDRFVEEEKSDRKPWHRIAVGGLGALISGWINNLTGAGGGMLLVFSLLLGFGRNVLNTAGTAKFMLMLNNFSSAALFLWLGYVDVPMTGTMLAGHFIGGMVGARFFLQRKTPFLKHFFYAIVVVMIAVILLKEELT